MLFFLFIKFVVVVLFIFVSYVWVDVCDDVELFIDIDVVCLLIFLYILEQNEYWLEVCLMLKFVCIVFLIIVDEVVVVVCILVNYDYDFVVKSGGYSFNKYFVSVEEGFLIFMFKIEYVDFDQNMGILKVGFGNWFDGIVKKFDGIGWIFVGGRIGNIGIGKIY